MICLMMAESMLPFGSSRVMINVPLDPPPSAYATGMKSEAAAELTGKQFGVRSRQIFRDLKAARENS